jgi:hypothetical protein
MISFSKMNLLAAFMNNSAENGLFTSLDCCKGEAGAHHGCSELPLVGYNEGFVVR